MEFTGKQLTAMLKMGLAMIEADGKVAVVGGALLQMATGIPGILGANIGYGRTWHQFCCHDCHESFKVRLGVGGYVKEVRTY